MSVAQSEMRWDGWYEREKWAARKTAQKPGKINKIQWCSFFALVQVHPFIARDRQDIYSSRNLNLSASTPLIDSPSSSDTAIDSLIDMYI